MGNYDHQGTRLSQVHPTTPLNDYLSECIGEAAFDRAGMKPEQLTMLSSFRMEHQESCEKKYLGRICWHAWSGWAGTPLQDAIDERHPCLKVIMPATGEAPPPNCQLGEECGTTRFCKHCETVLKLLSQTWRVPLMADVLIALLRRAIEGWVDGKEWQTGALQSSAGSHQCGPMCHFNPVKGV
jgi:hypothetical protein